MDKWKEMWCKVGEFWWWMMVDVMRASFWMDYFMDKVNWMMKIRNILAVFKMENVTVKDNWELQHLFMRVNGNIICKMDKVQSVFLMEQHTKEVIWMERDMEKVILILQIPLTIEVIFLKVKYMVKDYLDGWMEANLKDYGITINLFKELWNGLMEDFMRDNIKMI